MMVDNQKATITDKVDKVDKVARKRKYANDLTKGSVLVDTIVNYDHRCLICGKFGHGVHICCHKKEGDQDNPPTHSNHTLKNCSCGQKITLSKYASWFHEFSLEPASILVQ